MHGVNILNQHPERPDAVDGARAAERTRIQTILTHPAAVGRPTMAKALALTTRATVDESVAQLTAAPLEPAAAGASANAEMWSKAVAEVNRRNGRAATAGGAPTATAPQQQVSSAALWGNAVAEVNRRNGFSAAAE